MDNTQFVKEHMRHYVKRLNDSEEAITLLYNAAALNHALSGEKQAIYDGIKAQEEALKAYCKKERERLAAIIRNDGKVVRDMSIPFVPFTCIVYEYDDECYVIETEYGETTNIRCCRKD